MNTALVLLVLSSVFENSFEIAIRSERNVGLEMPPDFLNRDHIRRKRYLGLGGKFKLNKRYQECIAPGDIKGHCKHLTYCNTNIFTPVNVLQYLCVIERTFVGICCPDDIISSGVAGSQLVIDLPAGGYDYEQNENTTGCGIASDRRTVAKNGKVQEWPWIAALYRPKQLEQGVEQQFCGGALITDTHILTAAHCIQGPTYVVGTQSAIHQKTTTFLANTATNIELHLMKIPCRGLESTGHSLQLLVARRDFVSITPEDNLWIDDFGVVTPHQYRICLPRLDASEISVRLGEYNFKTHNETRSRDHAVAEIIEHEDFVLATYENDIAIVRLQKPTSFNTYIWPICLPPTNENYENKTVTVAGWGQQYYAGPVSAVLLQVDIPIWPQQKCVDSFVQRITDDNLCAAGFEGGKDSCLGDSGGPLMYQLDNDRWVSIGVVSWGIGCGNKNSPGIYTKVANYIPWIVKHTMSKQ